MKLIESPKNSSFTDAKKLLTGKGVKKLNQFLLSGKKLISECLKETKVTQGIWWIKEGMSDDPALLNGWPCNTLSRELFAELDVLGTNAPLLQCPLPQISAEIPEPKGATLLLAMGDPTNLGAIIRTATAFGITEAILLSESCNPFLPKSLKASAGTCLNMTFYKGPSIQDLPLSPLVGLDMKGLSLREGVSKIPQDFYLLAGEEGPGLPQKNLDYCLSIPTKGVESLNVTVAMSIFLYEWSNSNN